MKDRVIVSLADAKYFELLNELIDSILSFKESESVSICILDAGLQPDQIKILENAKEIHFIDSSYSVLIYFLSLTNEKIKQIPKYFHYYANQREGYTIYENPIPKNWQILK